MPLPPRYIVAEVSKTWRRTDGDFQPNRPPAVIAETFEQVLNTNTARGYRLHSFRFNNIMVDDGVLTETIVAVFELEFARMTDE
jgi:hypothetical protein